MRYGSVVFDMDGVILNYEADNFEWKYKAVDRVLEEHGVNPGKLSREQKDRLIGDKGLKSINEECDSLGIDTREVWADIAEETSKARAVQIKNGNFDLYLGVRETLDELQNEVKMALVSNAPEMAVRETINFFDLKSYFSYFRGIEDFEDLSDRKPAPDHLEFARVELKREPFLYVGDRNVDVKAAKNAGMDSAIVQRSYSDITDSPSYTVETISEILEIIRDSN